MKEILVSVIIVTHNDGAWLAKCLESIYSQTVFDDIEVIIIDSGSTDNTPELAGMLSGGRKNVKVISHNVNLGYDTCSNIGAKIAYGTFLYFLNSDVWLEPKCLKNLIAATTRDNSAGAAGSVLKYDSDEIHTNPNYGMDIFGNGIRHQNGRFPGKIFCPSPFWFIRRDVFLNLGGFDDGFFMYGEEVDLAWRLLASGQLLSGEKGAFIHHRHQVFDNSTNSNRRFYANRNRLAVICKNAQHVLLLMLIPCSILILIEGVIVLAISRKFSEFIRSSLFPFEALWRMRIDILKKRAEINKYRKHGDFWMLRYIKFGFGRIDEIKRIVTNGIPKFT